MRGRDEGALTRRRRALAALAACVAGAVGATAVGACGSSVVTGPAAAVDGDASSDAYAPAAPTGSCAAVVQAHPIEGETHVPICSVVDYLTNPPSSGNHYPIWADYQTYTVPVPLGFLVHDLEHGAIVLTYNCDKGGGGEGGASECEGEVAAAQQMIDALPVDQECVELGEGVLRRAVLVPDPDLDVRFAASAWGWTIKADCFDPTAFQAFALAHYKQGPEDLCEEGEDPTMQGLPANCGTE